MKRRTPTHLSISGGSGTFPGHDAVKAQLTEAHDGPYDSIHFHLHRQLNGFYALPTSTYKHLFSYSSSSSHCYHKQYLPYSGTVN
jgi:hypothetical protein